MHESMTEQRPSKDVLIAKAEQLELYERKKWYFNPQEYSWLAAQLRQLVCLQIALRGIQSCSTCEACRGAATRALGGASAEPAVMPFQCAICFAPFSTAAETDAHFVMCQAQTAQPPGDGQ